MKNKQLNVGSFATAKLQAISRRLIAIALAAAIGFSMVACEDGVGSPGGGGGGGGGSPNGLTVTGLPSISGTWYAHVFPQGTTISTRQDYDRLRTPSNDQREAFAGVRGNTFPLHLGHKGQARSLSDL